MLVEHAQTTLSTFVLALVPSPPIANRVHEAAGKVAKHFDLRDWMWLGERTGYMFREHKRRLMFGVEPTRILFQMLGVSDITAEAGELAELTATVLSSLVAADIRKVEFRVQTFVKLRMKHPEMTDLMFGSILQGAPDLSKICGPVEDALVALYGEREGSKVRIQIAPQTRSQVKEELRRLPNLPLFTEDDFEEDIAVEFARRCMDDSLYIDALTWREKTTANKLGEFTAQMVRLTDEAGDSVLARLTGPTE